MKKFFSVILISFITLNCNAQFWQGFQYGIMQGIQNAARQQNNYRQQPTKQRTEDDYHESRKIESDGFEWIQTNSGYAIQGAKSSTGSILIPLSKGYRYVIYCQDEGTGYFYVSKDDNKGIYNLSGREIIPVSRGYSSVIMDEYSGEIYYIVKKDDAEGLCDANGREIISPNRGYTSVYMEKCLGANYYEVKKDNSTGLCDANGREIISPSRGYSSICFFEEKGHKGYFKVEKNGKKGACDITGKEIIPCIYESLLFSSDKFEYKDNAGKWVATNVSLDANGYGVTSGATASNNTNSNTISSSSAATATSQQSNSSKYYEIGDQFFSGSKTYYIHSFHILALDPKIYKGNKNLFIVNGKKVTRKWSDGGKSTFNVISGRQNLPVMNLFDDNVTNIPLYKTDNDDIAVRVIKMGDGTIKFYEYVYNLSSGLYVPNVVFDLKP